MRNESGLLDRRSRLVGAMLLVVALIAGLAVWDQRREAADSVEGLRLEQASLAAALGAYVRERAATARQARDDRELLALLFEGLSPLERPGNLEIFLIVPGRGGVLGDDGVVVAGEALRQATLRGETSRVLERDQAPAFGLPRRMAVAGLHRFEVSGEVWGVASVASAQRLRDRWRRAELRLVLGVGLVGAVVVAFGGLALRTLRKELTLERRLYAQERDALLASADKMATLAALGTGIAHEIASPLGVIALRVEQLQGRYQGDERVGQPLGVIAAQVQRIEAVMRGVLALARGESPALAQSEPARLVEVAASQVRHRFENAAISLSMAVEPALPLVSCDARLIEQALVNLLLNAAGAPGVSEVTLGATRAPGVVRFFIEDDGEGMRPEVIQQAARPFFTTKSPGAGTGLGLTITHEIVKHHQGQLRLGSAKSGRGTRAEIELPAAASTEER